MPSLPTRIKVGYRDIEVAQVERGSLDGDAEYDGFEGRIRVPDDAPVQYLAELVTHELDHAIWDISGLPDCGATEEQIVSAFARSWLQIWRDNPDLIAFIDGALRSQNTTS